MRRLDLLLKVAAICGLLLMPAERPAYALDCVRATTTSEHAICSVAELRAADERMNSLYAALRKSLPSDQFSALHADQHRWLVDRDTQCADRKQGRTQAQVCLTRAYARRNDDLAWLTACSGKGRTRQPDCAIKGEWRVVSVLTGSSGVQAVAKNDPRYMGAVLVVNATELRFRGETCRAPSWMPELTAATHWFDENFSDTPDRFGWSDEVAQRLRILRLTCAAGGSIGPVAAGPSEFLLRSDSTLGLSYYDGSFLVLHRMAGSR